MYPSPMLRLVVAFDPIMGAGDCQIQACSSCALYHWAYRDQWVTLVTIGSACVPNQDADHGLVAVRLAAVKAMTGVLHPWSPYLNIKPVTISTTVWEDLIG